MTKHLLEFAGLFIIIAACFVGLIQIYELVIDIIGRMS